ncbi:hypothetical protein NDU88_003729 [Pleurodeles waltl]|uniref:Uncharacterized protein n=1 Tax=Pleurodeles waltl TaxID=8319 RepID=A0AAV7RDY4_PLEWA|nr:hypothetical protein NDU88_003729 [Pleurodeles waltl]
MTGASSELKTNEPLRYLQSCDPEDEATSRLQKVDRHILAINNDVPEVLSRLEWVSFCGLVREAELQDMWTIGD